MIVEGLMNLARVEGAPAAFKFVCKLSEGLTPWRYTWVLEQLQPIAGGYEISAIQILKSHGWPQRRISSSLNLIRLRLSQAEEAIAELIT